MSINAAQMNFLPEGVRGNRNFVLVACRPTMFESMGAGKGDKTDTECDPTADEAPPEFVNVKENASLHGKVNKDGNWPETRLEWLYW